MYRTRRIPSAPATTTWAGRVTVPEPFALTNSITMDNVHRRKCMHEIEAAKIQKEVDDELMISRSFKGKCCFFSFSLRKKKVLYKSIRFSHTEKIAPY